MQGNGGDAVLESDIGGPDGEFYGGSGNGGAGGAGSIVQGGDGNGGGVGIYAYPGGGDVAGYFEGNVEIDGNLSKNGGSFKIDHPVDPENKYLYHSFVESPDMMDIYNGNVVTDGGGRAVITLPDGRGPNALALPGASGYA